MADPKGLPDHPGARAASPRRPVPVRMQGLARGLRGRVDDADAARARPAAAWTAASRSATTAVPLGNLIPEWNDLVCAGRLARRRSSGCTPRTTSPSSPAGSVPGAVRDRVRAGHQPAPGDDQAGRGLDRRPGLRTRAGSSRSRPDRLTGKTVAVVGSGPAGLAAAQQLTRAGHTVAVFERADRIGGLLRYGIPEFKMEKRHLDRRLAQMEAEGTRFRPGVEIGDGHHRTRSCATATTPSSSRSGRRRARDLPVPGRELAGRPPGDGVPAAGQPGARWAIDGRRPGRRDRQARRRSSAAATPAPTASARRSARARASVTQLEIMPRPPEDRPGGAAVADVPDDLPGLERPRGGRRARLRRQHRRRSSATARAACAALRVVEVELADGRFVPVEGSEREIPADLVLLAMGFTGPERGPSSSSSVSSSTRGAPSPAMTTYATNGPRRVRRRRRRTRPVADRVGDRRGPIRRGRGRSMADGEYRAACADPADRAAARGLIPEIPDQGPRSVRQGRSKATGCVPPIVPERFRTVTPAEQVKDRSKDHASRQDRLHPRARAVSGRIRQLVEAGMDVARLNLSHGDYAEHEARYREVREAGEVTGRAVGDPGRPAGSEDPPRARFAERPVTPRRR